MMLKRHPGINGSPRRNPDDLSNASGRKWLLASGQLRASEAGSGF
jgi:hypothetical protein